MNPTPPANLGKETVRVWHGWYNIGDKEVTREAAAKGSHINLAVTFLALRRKVDFDQAEVWFKAEVLKWVDELLQRKQIFKASHVLNNVGVDPVTQFTTAVYTTCDKNLRDYICLHLDRTGNLDENIQDLWNFLNMILENCTSISKYHLSLQSLESLDNLSNAVRSEIATVVFLKTKDPSLSKFLYGETLWKHLLLNNDIDNLLLWINLQYENSVDKTVDRSMMELFKKFDITDAMLKLVADENLNVSADLKNAIYNELSVHGIFQMEEKGNFLLILERLKNSFSMGRLYQILTKSHSIVNVEDFMCLLVNYCLNHKYFHILNVCVKDVDISLLSADTELIKDFRLLIRDFTEDLLSKNIYKVVEMLSDDVTSYFNKNPSILLSLLLFTKEIDIVNTLMVENALTIHDVKLQSKCVLSMLNTFQILSQIHLNYCSGRVHCYLKIYELIDKHLNSESRILFDFRNSNKKLSHFYITDCTRAYGYSNKINYKSYLKHSRPSIAVKFLTVHNVEIVNSKSNVDAKLMEKKICKLATANFNNKQICSGCVFYLEGVGIGSTKLRTLVKIAHVLSELADCQKESVLDLLMNSEDDPYNLQNILEQLLMDDLEANPILTGSQLIETFRAYEVLIHYSKISSIRLPELFLKHCASCNFWLPFLIFAQINDYPLEQIKLLLQFFKSPNMLEHLTHGVANDTYAEGKSTLIRERDSRKHLLSKVGVRKLPEEIEHGLGSLKSQSSYDSQTSSTDSDTFEIDVLNIKATLLQTLITCHNSTDPPRALLQACQLYRNPLLSIFATSYEPDSLITNWLTWLSVSCELCKVFTNYETTAVSANLVSDLLVNCFKNRYPRTVLESFEIFLLENPLKYFLHFLIYCQQLNFNNSALTFLHKFESSLKNCRKNSIIIENDPEITYLSNRTWIELTALKLLAALLEHNCTSLYEQILIVENLCKIEIWKYFLCECVNFSNLLRILKILFYSNSCVYLDIVTMFDTKNSRQAIICTINELLEKKKYEVALKITQIENLPPDLILVKEWQSKINDRNDQNFWNTCNETFLENNVTADCVVDFYLDCLEKLCDPLEKFTLCKFAWEWATKYELSLKYELEIKMWLLFLYLDEKYKDLHIFEVEIAPPLLYQDMNGKLSHVTEYEGELNKDFVSQLERIVVFALEKDNFWLALKLQKMFRCKCSDLEILKLCHNLAEGVILPHQLNAEQRILLSNVDYLKTYAHRRTFLSTRFSSLSSSSHSAANSLQMQTLDSVDSYVNDTLAVLKMLLEHLHAGVGIGQKIFMNYRISINIEIPYQAVFTTTDYMKLLKTALEDDCSNKIDVIHDFIIFFKWSKHEMVDFICEELINATMSYINSNVDHIVMWDINISQDFPVVLQLLQDNCSLLGYQIFSYANTLHRSRIQSDQLYSMIDLILVIELLIKAHDCFTADCNMEGISAVLKKSKEVVAHLLVLQDWKLMVRLLTGVARYTEMNYVFQILKENDQFEFLLRKGFRKDNTLKVALLDYLKKHCPDNRDLFKIVALHFGLFSEVAVLWEREAQNVIKNLISVSILEMQNNKLDPEEEPYILLQNTESTKNCLNKAMENYIHATDFHLQGDKLSKATNSAQQAELLALQLALLKEASVNSWVVCILNLTNDQISTLLTSKLSFEQSLLLVEAYNFHVDWASVVYQQYVIRNNDSYLESFLQNLPLTDTLVQDISRKFIASGMNSFTEIKCMKYILSKSPSPHIKYKIASELGFADLIEEQIVSGHLIYLKDTVWKKGFKN